jgi:transcriptional regulator with XRE-family HTH domain
MTLHALTRLARDDDYMVPEWTLGDRMRKALEVSGTPVGEIAEYLEVNRATVGRWLHDKSPVKKSTLIIWAATTGVDLGWLETGTAGLENQTGRDQYAIRDSNPEPADMSSARRLTLVGGVNRRLSVNRIPAGWPIPEPSEPREAAGSARTRHLSAVS